MSIVLQTGSDHQSRLMSQSPAFAVNVENLPCLSEIVAS